MNTQKKHAFRPTVDEGRLESREVLSAFGGALAMQMHAFAVPSAFAPNTARLFNAVSTGNFNHFHLNRPNFNMPFNGANLNGQTAANLALARSGLNNPFASSTNGTAFLNNGMTGLSPFGQFAAANQFTPSSLLGLSSLFNTPTLNSARPGNFNTFGNLGGFTGLTGTGSNTGTVVGPGNNIFFGANMGTMGLA